jgi:FkbM family methyltransferase
LLGEARDVSPPHLDPLDGVVVVGAGRVGREFLSALTASGISVLSFADNDPAKWGTTVAGHQVRSVPGAVGTFGNRCLYLVAVGRTGGEGIMNQLRLLGASHAMHFIPAIRQLPRVWPTYFLGPADFDLDHLDDCIAAYSLLADEESRMHFRSHLRWRAALDPSQLSAPSYDDQYFVKDIVVPEQCRSFVDVGAYTGDTLTALSDFAGGSLRAYYGFEPDPTNYALLQRHVGAISATWPDVTILISQVAVGADRRDKEFRANASDTAQVSPTGETVVRSIRLDDLDLPSPTYLKVDVEGGEAEVLRGATELLKTDALTVAIATYHRPTDLFALPLHLSRTAPNRRHFLRSHGDAGIDLICYVTSASR